MADSLAILDYDDRYTIGIERPDFSIFRNTSNNEYPSFRRGRYKYYTIPHNSEYKIKLGNNTETRVDAILKIDGSTMGTWRIEAYSEIVVDRPTYNNRKFTFVREASWQGDMGGVTRGNTNNGLVEVTFIPELIVYRRNEFDGSAYAPASARATGAGSGTPTFNEARGLAATNQSYSVGGTVLGADSSQRFSRAPFMVRDYSRQVVRRVRLVVDEQIRRRRPYVSIREPGYNDDGSLFDDPIPPQLGRDQYYYYDNNEYTGPYSDTTNRVERFGNHDHVEFMSPCSNATNRVDRFDEYYEPKQSFKYRSPFH